MTRVHRVYIEITNRCNLNCTFCPGQGNRPAAAMTVDDFETILTKVAPWTDEVTLHVLGEPLVHPDFDQIVDACSAHFVPVHLTTNGTLLARHADKLLDPAFRQINFSLQALEFAPSAQYLDAVEEFCLRALALRPELYINLRLWNLESAQAAEESPRSVDLLDRIQRTFHVNIAPGNDVLWRKSRRLAGRIYWHRDTRFEWPGVPGKVRQGFCHGLESHFGVLVDGTVVPCCLDGSATMPLGNLISEPLEAILDGPRAVAIRDGFGRRELVEATCQGCTFRTRFDRR